MILGNLILIDSNGSEFDKLDKLSPLSFILREACVRGGATVIDVYSQTFAPHGVTVLAKLAEGHAALHTFPERGIWIADFLMYDQAFPHKSADYLEEQLGGVCDRRIIPRPLSEGFLKGSFRNP